MEARLAPVSCVAASALALASCCFHSSVSDIDGGTLGCISVGNLNSHAAMDAGEDGKIRFGGDACSGCGTCCCCG